MVIERRAYGDPACALDVDALSRDIDVIGQIEVCIPCGIALLNVLRQKSELVAGGYTVVSSGQSIRFTVVQLRHCRSAFIDHVIRIIGAIDLTQAARLYILGVEGSLKYICAGKLPRRRAMLAGDMSCFQWRMFCICAERIDPIVERIEHLELFSARLYSRCA